MASVKELHLIAGSRVRLKAEFLPSGHNQREVFMLTLAPVSGNDGKVMFTGLLSGIIIEDYANGDCVAEKIND